MMSLVTQPINTGGRQLKIHDITRRPFTRDIPGKPR
jgi:hypothetical protein